LKETEENFGKTETETLCKENRNSDEEIGNQRRKFLRKPEIVMKRK